MSGLFVIATVLLAAIICPKVFTKKWNLDGQCLDGMSIYNLSGYGGNISHKIFNISQYDGYCSKILLMDRRYALKEIVKLQRINFFSISGNTEHNNSIEIKCDSDGGFIFEDSDEIYLENLHFIGCSFNIVNYLENFTSASISFRASVVFLNSSGVHLNRCLFSNQSGYAIVIINGMEIIEIEHSNFTGEIGHTSELMHGSGGILIWKDKQCCRHILLVYCYFVGYNGGSGKDSALIPQGGAISIFSEMSNVCDFNLTLSKCTFINNVADYGAAINIAHRGSMTVSGVNVDIWFSKFISNIARKNGGAIHVLFDNFTFNTINFVIHSCVFNNNTAVTGGGVAIAVQGIQNADHILIVSLINSSWFRNSAAVAGYAVELNGMAADKPITNKKLRTIQAYIQDCNFVNNKAIFQSRGCGAVSVTATQVDIVEGLTFFEGNEGTALCLKMESLLNVHGKLTFSHNTGLIGGAILLYDHAQMYISTSSVILFANNSALIMGGAIYSMVSGNTQCPFAFSNKSSTNYNVTFYNNSANQVDQSLFVQNSVRCRSNKDILTNIFKYYPANNTTVFLPLTEISFFIAKSASHAVENQIEVMLGEHFSLVIKEIRDWFGLATTYEVNHLWVSVISNNDNFTLVMSNNADSVDIFSSYNHFYVKGPNTQMEVRFDIDFYVHEVTTYHVGNTIMSVNIIPCTLGYIYSTENRTCKCASYKSDKIQCPSDRQELCVRYRYWYSDKFEIAVPCPAQNCWFMYDQCPENTEICSGYSKVYCSIRSTDDVCWDGRGGFLCSECASNYSFTFRAFQCAKTSTCNHQNTFFVLLILFLYWGIYALSILAVLSLNLRVGSGFMYGIVYYFSVVTIYTSSNPLFSDLWLRLLVYISIAITQLDPELLGFGVRVCFIKSWTNPLPHQLFHYTTPIFVTLLIFSYILISRYCRLPKKFSLANTSPIHAICMLILFSYTSLCITNFKILIPVVLFDKLRVRAAPIVPYFGTSHLPYAIFALIVELFIAIPMCILFLFAPCISSRINLVKYKLKPILDEFQACYHPNRRWFAGYYFVARQFVYLLDGVVSESFPQHNSILLTLNITILLIHISFQPYQNKWINVLDTILLLDIVFLSIYSVSLPNNDALYVNQVIHDNFIPSLLILIPTLYLLGICAIGLFLVLKKCVLNCRCSSKIQTRALNSSFTKSFVHVHNEEMEGEFHYLADDFHCRPPESDNNVSI